MNDIQKQVLEYMQAVCDQEDVYFLEAWKAVELYVLDALSD